MQSGHILVLGSYPCRVPMHGGQIRLAEIISAYRRQGYTVQSINLYDRLANAGQPAGEHDFDYPASSHWRLWENKAIPLIEDLTSGRYAAGDEGIYTRITKGVQGDPLVIHMEQPWLLPLVSRWKEEGRFPGARIVYGSQNVEAPLKTAILKQYGITDAERIAQEIQQLEKNACAIADVILAVSSADQQELERLSGKRVVLAANGIAAWQAQDAAVVAWKKKLPPRPFALFVGSAHPPNISGFYDVLGSSMGFLPPDRKIVVLGGVGPHLLEHSSFRAWAPLNRSRLQILGLVDEQGLAAVKDLAHVVILPITEGGGSNIKTAEALYSGKYVLGTPTSFRGFHDYLGMPGVHVAEPGEAFRNILSDLLHRPPLQLEPRFLEQRQSLLWLHTLKPMLTAVEEVLQS